MPGTFWSNITASPARWVTANPVDVPSGSPVVADAVKFDLILSEQLPKFVISSDRPVSITSVPFKEP